MRDALAGLLALAVASPGVIAELNAQIPADRTYLEFTSPVRIPGATLAPGMYLFAMGAPVGDQLIVDVYSADGSRWIATCLMIESKLPRPAGRTTTDFPRVSPKTLRAWFQPASLIGLEFVYSQAEARELFAETGLSIPYAAFKPANRDLLGAFPVRRVTPLPVVGVAAPGTLTPTVVGTRGVTAVFEPFDESLGPHEHLTTARRLLAAHARTVSPSEKLLFETVERQISHMQAAYRKNNRKDVAASIQTVERTIVNLLPNEEMILARRQVRPPRETVIVLQRVAAHVRAFSRVAAPVLRAVR